MVSTMETKPSLLVRVRDPLDAEAWQTFVALYAPLVYRFLRRRSLQDADAADLTQEVMGEVSRAIRSFEYHPERGRFRDWLLLIITRRRLIRFHEQGHGSWIWFRVRTAGALRTTSRPTRTGMKPSMLGSSAWPCTGSALISRRRPGKLSSGSGWSIAPRLRRRTSCR